MEISTRTIKDILTDFTPEVAEKALANAEKQNNDAIHSSVPEFIQFFAKESLQVMALKCAFSFNGSNEGVEYWANICINPNEYLKNQDNES